MSIHVPRDNGCLLVITFPYYLSLPKEPKGYETNPPTNLGGPVFAIINPAPFAERA
jgi:hypothetical protein